MFRDLFFPTFRTDLETFIKSTFGENYEINSSDDHSVIDVYLKEGSSDDVAYPFKIIMNENGAVLNCDETSSSIGNSRIYALEGFLNENQIKMRKLVDSFNHF